MNGKYTVEQIIGITKELLEGIRLPVKEREAAGTINAAIGNLEVCLNAIEAAKAQQPAEEPAAEEPAEPGMEPLMVLKGEEAGAEDAAEE